MKDLIYDVREVPKKWYEWIVYPIQMLLAVFVATVLIAGICHTDPGMAMLGAAIGTIIYEIITGFHSPMFISSCGATVSAVLGALCLGGAHWDGSAWVGNPNYVAVAIGGGIIFLVYAIFALIIKLGGKKAFDRIFPPAIVGSITVVIGVNLAGFLPSYIGVSWIPLVVALVTMITTAVFSHYLKGFWRSIAFLLGLLVGYLLAVVLETSEAYDFRIVNAFQNMQAFDVKSFAFMQWANSPFEPSQIPQIILFFLPLSICAALEHYSDHKVLSNIIGTDLTQRPGMDRTLLGDGAASAIGTIICGQPNTSYGESIATIGFSRVASVWVTLVAAIILGALAFIPPVSAFVNSIPAAVFGGCAMILYGYIAASGLKTLKVVNLDDNKQLIITAVVLTIGASGLALALTTEFSLEIGVALAMIAGIVLNLILRDKKSESTLE